MCEFRNQICETCEVHKGSLAHASEPLFPQLQSFIPCSSRMTDILETEYLSQRNVTPVLYCNGLVDSTGSEEIVGSDRIDCGRHGDGPDVYDIYPVSTWSENCDEHYPFKTRLGWFRIEHHMAAINKMRGEFNSHVKPDDRYRHRYTWARYGPRDCSACAGKIKGIYNLKLANSVRWCSLLTAMGTLEENSEMPFTNTLPPIKVLGETSTEKGSGNDSTLPKMERPAAKRRRTNDYKAGQTPLPSLSSQFSGATMGASNERRPIMDRSRSSYRTQTQNSAQLRPLMYTPNDPSARAVRDTVEGWLSSTTESFDFETSYSPNPFNTLAPAEFKQRGMDSHGNNSANVPGDASASSETMGRSRVRLPGEPPKDRETPDAHETEREQAELSAFDKDLAEKTSHFRPILPKKPSYQGPRQP